MLTRPSLEVAAGPPPPQKIVPYNHQHRDLPSEARTKSQKPYNSDRCESNRQKKTSYQERDEGNRHDSSDQLGSDLSQNLSSEDLGDVQPLNSGENCQSGFPMDSAKFQR